MAGDPNELLIFKMRQKRVQGEEPAITTTKPAPVAEVQPAPSAPVRAPSPKLPKPTMFNRAPKEYRPPEPESFISQQAPSPKSPIVLAPPQQKAEKLLEQKYPDPRSYYLPEHIGSRIEEYVATYGKYMDLKSKSESKSAAKDLFCAWHPWRHAYAICGSCHRPFCYEDTVEYKRGYYCMEDIEDVEQKRTEKLQSEYNATSLISAGITLLAFLLFIYFVGGQLVYIYNYVNRIGFAQFITTIQPDYVFALLGVFLMVLSMGVAIYAMTATRASNVMGVVTGIIAVVFFSYMYITTGASYLGLMALLEFLSFTAFVYSSATAIKVYETPMETQTIEAMIVPNVNKF